MGSEVVNQGWPERRFLRCDFATRQGWVAHLDGVLRPAIESWAANRAKTEASATLSAAGIAAGPCFTAEEVVRDEHLRARDMLVEMARVDGVDQPVLIPGNPVKISDVPEAKDARVPWLGEHTDQVLGAGAGDDRRRHRGLAPRPRDRLRKPGGRH